MTDHDPGEMALRKLVRNEAVDLILQVLREAGEPLTTRERKGWIWWLKD